MAASARPQPPSITPRQRFIQRLAAPGPVSRALAPLLHTVDRLLLNLSGDRVCLTSLAAGLPVRLIVTTGAVSGLRRAHPLTAIPDGDRLGLIASNFGRARHPAWYRNLIARPRVQVRLAGRLRPYVARPASDDEYALYWARAVDLYPGYADYARRAAPRRIPIVVLEPDADRP